MTQQLFDSVLLYTSLQKLHNEFNFILLRWTHSSQQREKLIPNEIIVC